MLVVPPINVLTMSTITLCRRHPVRASGEPFTTFFSWRSCRCPFLRWRSLSQHIPGFCRCISASAYSLLLIVVPPILPTSKKKVIEEEEVIATIKPPISKNEETIEELVLITFLKMWHNQKIDIKKI